MFRRTTFLLVAIFVASLGSILSAQSACASEPVNLAITNIRNTSFTVSWLTGLNENGQIQLIGGSIYDDDRGAGFNGVLHYVTVTGVQADHQYLFDVISGGKTYDNAGTHWTLHTGAGLAPRSSDLIFGQIRFPEKSNDDTVIVFATISRIQQGFPSAPLSTLVTERAGGLFSLDLAEARTFSDASSYFEYSQNSDRYMNNCVTIYVASPSVTGLATFDMTDLHLLANDPNQRLFIETSLD